MDLTSPLFLQLAHQVPFLLKLTLAMLLGLLLGLERTHAHKMAGMRTYALVSMGSCMFIIIANEIINSSFRYTGIDPVRMAGAIVTGIGFLCGGLIVFNHERLVGLTTAAGMWIATGIGIAVGYDLYIVAIFVTLLTLFVFTILWQIELGVKKHSTLSDESYS